MIQEGVIAGIPAIEVWDWTVGEIMEQISANHERRRREGQLLAQVAVGQLRMSAARFSNGANPEIWEAFPFWTEEEIARYKVEKYKRLMWRHVGGGGNV